MSYLCFNHRAGFVLLDLTLRLHHFHSVTLQLIISLMQVQPCCWPLVVKVSKR